jgi:hypothetical protein
MKIDLSGVDVRKFVWFEGAGELHVDVVMLMDELAIQWSAANEREVTLKLVQAFYALVPSASVHHLVDRKPPRGN